MGIMPNHRKRFQWGTWSILLCQGFLKAGDEENVLLKMSDEGIIDEKHKGSITEKNPRVACRSINPPLLSAGTIKSGLKLEILSDDGHIYRPDRVILREEEPVVLDFKTGKPKKEQEKQIGHLVNC